MTQGYTDFYQFESLWKIMKGEDKRGKLQTDYYSQEVKDISEYCCPVKLFQTK